MLTTEIYYIIDVWYRSIHEHIKWCGGSEFIVWWDWSQSVLSTRMFILLVVFLLA